jgi:hypothetical protein
LSGFSIAEGARFPYSAKGFFLEVLFMFEKLLYLTFMKLSKRLISESSYNMTRHPPEDINEKTMMIDEKLAEREWIAIKFYCNKRYRKAFISEHRNLLLFEGLASTVKSWWNSAKEKTKGFLDGIKNIAGNLVPGSFLVGLSKLGEAGKKIWEFISSLAGNAYKWMTDCVDKAKQFIENGKAQLVANVLNLILKVIYPKNVNLYNQIVTACKQAGINTGLEPAQTNQPQQQVKEGIVGAAIKGANLVAGGGEDSGGNPRETVANLVENAFKTITDLLSDKIKQQIVETLFPFNSASMEAVGITLMIPLAQASGGLSFEVLVDFVQQIVNTIKHGAAKAAGKISLFREYKEFLLEIKSSFIALLVKNFDSITGAIVGLIKGSNAEMLIRAAGGDAGAAKDVVKQLLKILVDAVKKQMKETSDEEPSDEVLEKAADFLMGESKHVYLSTILFN